MAFGMKHWLGVVVLGCGILAVMQLPPRPFDSGRAGGRVPTPEEVRYRALRDDAVRSRTLLRRVRWSDTLPLALAREAQDGWALRVAGPIPFPSGPVDLLRTEFRQAVASIPDRRGDVLLGAFVERHDPPPDRAAWDGSARDILFGRTEGVSYCLAVDVRPATPGWTTLSTALTERSPDGTPRRNILGLCRWIAELGLPGPGITRWLLAGGAVFATQPTLDVSGTPARPWYEWGHLRRGPFGLGWRPAGRDACLAGIEASCAAFLANPRGSRILGPSTESRSLNDEVTSPDQAWLAWGTGWGNDRYATLMAELYEEFGRERTEAFWTSEGDVLQAFQEAFQMDAGSWMAERVRQDPTYVPPGPLPRLRGTLWALLVMVVCAGVASVAGQRRRIA